MDIIQDKQESHRINNILRLCKYVGNKTVRHRVENYLMYKIQASFWKISSLIKKYSCHNKWYVEVPSLPCSIIERQENRKNVVM